MVKRCQEGKMVFPDEEAKLKSGRISDDEKEMILIALGEIARAKYDEFIVQGGNAKGYNLAELKGSLQYDTDVREFDNDYYLDGGNEHWTAVANYFEYGTGLYNQRRAGRYRAGYITPQTAEYMKFVTKSGDHVLTKKVKGVHPIFAMEKAIKFIEFNRKRLQRAIRIELQKGD